MELKVGDRAFILAGRRTEFTYAVLAEHVSRNGATELVFTTGYDSGQPIFETYHFTLELDWKIHTLSILPIGPLDIQILAARVDLLQKDVKTNAFAISYGSTHYQGTQKLITFLDHSSITKISTADAENR